MPQIIVEMRDDFGSLFIEELRGKLALLAAELFTVEDRPLTRHDFGYKFHRGVVWPDKVTHDIIVRIHLHSDEERLKRSEFDAVMIRNFIAHLLDGHGHYVGTTGPTIGVSLTYGHTEWASGSLDDTSTQDLKQIFDALARQRSSGS